MLRYLNILVCLLLPISMWAGDGDFPAKPTPPRLVNDLAHMMSANEVADLESKLLSYEKTTSTQVTIVTIKNLGGYEVAQYAIELGNRWQVGQKGKDNGVLVLASLEDRKVNISTGYGLEGALTDALSGRIIRNEIVPEFKRGDYYQGFVKGTDAIIAATKGEYTSDKEDKKGDIPAPLIIIIIVVIYFVLWILSKIRGGGSGTYMSGRGHRGWHAGGWYGGGFGGSGFGGGGSSGGGGFGGFGGGSFGGGGASGSW